jgi:hypothetical protein
LAVWFFDDYEEELGGGALERKLCSRLFA